MQRIVIPDAIPFRRPSCWQRSKRKCIVQCVLRRECPRLETQKLHLPNFSLLSFVIVAGLASGSAANGFEIQAEPANALSLPTWAIHVSSVIEWVTAMGLFWKFAEVTGDQKWKGMTWGMLPSLGSALCACTWHFFYNAPSLEFLVATQALLTVVGNTTCAIAAYRIYLGAQAETSAR